MASIDNDSLWPSPVRFLTLPHGANVGHPLSCRSQASEFGGPFHPLDESAGFSSAGLAWLTAMATWTVPFYSAGLRDTAGQP